MDESPIHDPIFDIFRKNTNVNMQWIKEQVYGSPCVPETCPSVDSFSSIVKRLRLEEGEIRDNDRRNKMTV